MQTVSVKVGHFFARNAVFTNAYGCGEAHFLSSNKKQVYIIFFAEPTKSTDHFKIHAIAPKILLLRTHTPWTVQVRIFSVTNSMLRVLEGQFICGMWLPTLLNVISIEIENTGGQAVLFLYLVHSSERNGCNDITNVEIIKNS